MVQQGASVPQSHICGLAVEGTQMSAALLCLSLTSYHITESLTVWLSLASKVQNNSENFLIGQRKTGATKVIWCTMHVVSGIYYTLFPQPHISLVLYWFSFSFLLLSPENRINHFLGDRMHKINFIQIILIITSIILTLLLKLYARMFVNFTFLS